MKSSTLQFVVAGALIAAWAWMLGRPILTNLFRRSRRDSVGHFRYQQAVLSRPMGHDTGVARFWADRPRPLAHWRAQPLERRRLQLMLAFAIATFVSLLLAIALRGPFVRLFALMAVCFTAYLGVAVYIGSTQLRRMELDRRLPSAPARQQDLAPSSSRGSGRARAVEAPEAGDDHHEDVESFEDLELFGKGIFDEGFYEPIPELAFKPLDLDSSLFIPADEVDRIAEREPLFGDAPAADNSESADMSDSSYQPGSSESSVVLGADLFDRDPSGPPDPAVERDIYSWVGAPILDKSADDPDPDPEFDDIDGQPAADLDPLAADVEHDESPESEEQRPEPTFTAPVPQRTRPPKRNKARPIYIESQLDEGGEPIKAVND